LQILAGGRYETVEPVTTGSLAALVSRYGLLAVFGGTLLGEGILIVAAPRHRVCSTPYASGWPRPLYQIVNCLVGPASSVELAICLAGS